ncbi:MAG: hypothetical protein HRT89_04605, partial [Lentisphaeria bacterium]|nr:hypothetical protein [Lentisphaeria bacterium]
WTTKYDGDHRTDQGFISRYIDYDVKDPDSRWYSYILPVWFRGRTYKGEKFFAFFPIGGNLKDIMGYNKVSFWLFPIYLRTQKSTFVSTHWLFPIYNKVEGIGVSKHRIWPIWGSARFEGKWSQHFALWPFVRWGHSLNQDKPGSAIMIFPFYGHIQQETTLHGKLVNRTLLWPFFSYLKSKDQKRLMAPWPFFQKSKNMFGGDSDRLHLWPFYGRTRKGKSIHKFYLWPVFNSFYEPSKDTIRTRRYFAAIWTEIKNYDPKTKELKNKYRRLWPLGSYYKGEKHSLFRFLDLFPMRNLEPIERNLAPLWTLFYSLKQKLKNGDVLVKREALWGVWQYRKQKFVEKQSLFPLFSYHKAADNPSKKFNALLGLYGHGTKMNGDKYVKFLWFFKFRTSKAKVDAVQEN